MSDPQDLSGVWYGRYVSHSDVQDNGFIALIEDAGGAITGTITEPDPKRGGIRRASMSGRRSGQSLRFVKQYQGAWTHAVHYAGRIGGEGTEVAGSWKVEWVTGSFAMQREKFGAEELEETEETEIEVPVTLR